MIGICLGSIVKGRLDRFRGLSTLQPPIVSHSANRHQWRSIALRGSRPLTTVTPWIRHLWVC